MGYEGLSLSGKSFAFHLDRRIILVTICTDMGYHRNLTPLRGVANNNLAADHRTTKTSIANEKTSLDGVLSCEVLNSAPMWVVKNLLFTSDQACLVGGERNSGRRPLASAASAAVG